MTAAMIGWAHTCFGKLTGETVESLVTRVTREALADAGIEAKEVDEIVLGHFNAGFSAQDFTASLVLQASPDFRFKRATRVENACATGSAAVHQGLKAIAARSARIVLVVGVEQMSATPAQEVGRNLLKASYVREEADIDGGFAGIFGQIAALYFQKWGDQSDALALIAAKNHKNGVGNPYAQMRKDLGYDFCRHESEKNPFVAGPLKRSDCSLVSDGAAAVVLADVETALRFGKAVAFRAVAHVQDFLPMSRRDVLKFEGCTVAWRRALTDAGLRLDDQGRPDSGQSLGRTQGQGTSHRRNRRVDACDECDAAYGHRRGHPNRRRASCRYLQHGRHGRRKLREHSRAHQIAGVRSANLH